MAVRLGTQNWINPAPFAAAAEMVVDAGRATGAGIACVPPEAFPEPLWWGPSCAGQEIWLVFHARPGANKAALSGSLVKIAHIYRDPVAEAKAAGSCNIDASCASEPWASMLSGVGGLGTIDSTGVLFCTCSLIVSLDTCENSPLVLTANHCVRGQTGPATAGIHPPHGQSLRAGADGYEGSRKPGILLVVPDLHV